MGGIQKEIDLRDERALKRDEIVVKWWHGMIKKAARQSENLRKEGRSREV
jgi:hypothetical protein